MWQIQQVDNPADASLWFSDGLPVDCLRGGSGSSSRLIVGGQGFLDISDFQNGFPYGPIMDLVDLNGQCFNYTPNARAGLNLTLPGDGSFLAQYVAEGNTQHGILKPLPTVSASDVAFFDQMIEQKYVPYQNIPDAPGKSVAEIRALGQLLFPYSPCSFELAMAIYDWTTASFTRMVLLEIFAYTDVGEAPWPLDLDSIAAEIWASNWGSYNPQNADYMRSFLMQPASSQSDVRAQLAAVASRLQQFADVENRLLAVAFQSMPRTAVCAKPQLFSGQMDIYQLGTEHFGIEFLQCPLNAGPVGTPLCMPFEEVIDGFAAPGQVITNKMVWSFGDSMAEAMTYQNGILLIANPPPNEWVWDDCAFITPLSDDPAKIEYTFSPGTQFLVQSIQSETVNGKPVTIMNLQAQ